MRFLKELFNPALKCARIGHKFRVRSYSGYESTSSWSAVVDDVSGKIIYCPRCGYQHERTVEKRRGLQGFSCPSSMMDKINDEGFCES